jgi:hypothetical protein
MVGFKGEKLNWCGVSALRNRQIFIMFEVSLLELTEHLPHCFLIYCIHVYQPERSDHIKSGAFVVIEMR